MAETLRPRIIRFEAVSGVCNRKCSFCIVPEMQPPVLADLELWRQLCTQLPPDYTGQVNLTPLGELLLHSEWPNIVYTARNRMPHCSIYVHTNGDLFENVEHVWQYFYCGGNKLIVSCYAPQTYEKFREFALETSRIQWGFYDSEKNTIVPPVRSGLYGKVSSRKKVCIVLQCYEGADLTSVSRIRKPHSWTQAPVEQVNLALPCTQPFIALTIGVQGQLKLCCVDALDKAGLGHPSLNSGLIAQWLGNPKLGEYRQHFLAGGNRRCLLPCSTCDSQSYKHRFGLCTKGWRAHA